MSIDIEKAIQEGKQENIARKKAHEEELKKWVDTKLIEDIKESTARGYRHTVVKDRCLPMSSLNYKPGERLTFVRDYVAATMPSLRIENGRQEPGHRPPYWLDYFTINW